MKKLIAVSFLNFLLYLVLKLTIHLAELNTLLDSEIFALVGITLAFCVSVFLEETSNLSYCIGVNITWLSIALVVFIFNFSLLGQSYFFWLYLFFLIFPLGFLVKYLFFSKNIEERFSSQMASLVLLIFYSSLLSYLMNNW